MSALWNDEDREAAEAGDGATAAAAFAAGAAYFIRPKAIGFLNIATRFQFLSSNSICIFAFDIIVSPTLLTWDCKGTVHPFQQSK